MKLSIALLLFCTSSAFILVQVQANNSHCPKNCDGHVKQTCDEVLDILDNIPFIPEFVRDVVGVSISDKKLFNRSINCNLGCHLLPRRRET